MQYKEDAARIEQIRSWPDDMLIRELRSGMRATLGPEAYHLLFAEALARLLEAKAKAG